MCVADAPEQSPLYNSSYAVPVTPTSRHLCIDSAGLNSSCSFAALPDAAWDPVTATCNYTVIKVLCLSSILSPQSPTSILSSQSSHLSSLTSSLLPQSSNLNPLSSILSPQSSNQNPLTSILSPLPHISPLNSITSPYSSHINPLT